MQYGITVILRFISKNIYHTKRGMGMEFNKLYNLDPQSIAKCHNYTGKSAYKYDNPNKFLSKLLAVIDRKPVIDWVAVIEWVNFGIYILHMNKHNSGKIRN